MNSNTTTNSPKIQMFLMLPLTKLYRFYKDFLVLHKEIFLMPALSKKSVLGKDLWRSEEQSRIYLT